MGACPWTEVHGYRYGLALRGSFLQAHVLDQRLEARMQTQVRPMKVDFKIHHCGGFLLEGLFQEIERLLGLAQTSVNPRFVDRRNVLSPKCRQFVQALHCVSSLSQL